LIDSIALSPDAKTVLVGAAYRGGGVITAWDTGTGRITNRLRGHAGEVTELSFSPDSMMALSASDDGTLIIWDVSKGVIIGKWKDE
jgi:WD40 repeat protein